MTDMSPEPVSDAEPVRDKNRLAVTGWTDEQFNTAWVEQDGRFLYCLTGGTSNRGIGFIPDPQDLLRAAQHLLASQPPTPEA